MDTLGYIGDEKLSNSLQAFGVKFRLPLLVHFVYVCVRRWCGKGRNRTCFF